MNGRFLTLSLFIALSMLMPATEIRAQFPIDATNDVTFKNSRALQSGVVSGGQPNEDELAAAAAAGFKTVVNLRTPGELKDFDEQAVVEGLGMRYISIPVAGAAGLDRDNTERLAEVLADDALKPMVLHCGSGNRVGALVAMIAHDLEGQNAVEALRAGRAGGLTGMEPVVRERLGVSPIRGLFTVVDNHQNGLDDFRASLTLTNTGEEALPAAGWELYFNFIRAPRAASMPENVAYQHVNGDFHKFFPTESFAGLGSGESVEIAFDAGNWAVKESDAPSGYYLVMDGKPQPVEVEITPFTEGRQTDRVVGDETPVPTAASRYRENAALSLLSANELPMILPTPAKLEQQDGDAATNAAINTDWRIAAPKDLANEAAFLAKALGEVLGTAPEIGSKGNGHTISLKLNEALETESYRLETSANGVRIVGGDAAGVFYGVQSLLALIPPGTSGAFSVPAVLVEDGPRFPYRGMHLDVSRNFQDRAAVEMLLDQMAFYKLNRFHFHLTDDEGWRLEIPGLPELTEVGARRCHTTDERDCIVPSWGSGPFPDRMPGSGHYSRTDFVEILRYADSRHIEVIPEIDVPGHARAAIKAMEARHARLTVKDKAAANEFLLSDPEDASEYASVQMWTDNVINVCMPSTYDFLAKVVDEIVAMYKDAGAPLTTVHIGGDEVPHGVWQKSPACADLREQESNMTAYFLRRFADILDARGLVTAGWEEIGLEEPLHGTGGGKEPSAEFAKRGFQLSVWNNVWGWGAEDLGYRLANAGYKVVLSNATNLYFDLAYNKHPKEPGLYWAGLVNTRTAWEFVPMNLYQNARIDAWGGVLPPDKFDGATRLTPEGRKNVLGIQGQLWGENAISRARMEYLTFPKLLGLAERAWAASPAWAEEADRDAEEAAWNAFANTLGQREMPRMDQFDIGYRLPPPGAVVEDGKLKANTAFPGLAIRYTTDGSEPGASSKLYEGPVAVSGEVRLRSFDSRGRGSRTATVNSTN